MPDLIRDLVTNDSFAVFARIVLTSFFWIAGIVTLLKPAGILAAVRNAGLPAPRSIVAAMIVTELGGSALLVSDNWSLGWLGAGWLGVFTLLSIPLGHPFWRFPQPKRMEELQIALEHLALIGGLMCASVTTAV